MTRPTQVREGEPASTLGFAYEPAPQSVNDVCGVLTALFGRVWKPRPRH